MNTYQPSHGAYWDRYQWAALSISTLAIVHLVPRPSQNYRSSLMFSSPCHSSQTSDWTWSTTASDLITSLSCTTPGQRMLDSRGSSLRPFFVIPYRVKSRKHGSTAEVFYVHVMYLGELGTHLAPVQLMDVCCTGKCYGYREHLFDLHVMWRDSEVRMRLHWSRTSRNTTGLVPYEKEESS